METSKYIKIKAGPADAFFKKESDQLISLLKKQGKVVEPSIFKLRRCHSICSCELDDKIIAMGAVKPKTASDFNETKSGEMNRLNDFKWELGYMFTEEEFRGKGYSSRIIEQLFERLGKYNLMATTETDELNPMRKLLLRFGFQQYGNTWKSKIHGGRLGLFLKYIDKPTAHL